MRVMFDALGHLATRWLFERDRSDQPDGEYSAASSALPVIVGAAEPAHVRMLRPYLAQGGFRIVAIVTKDGDHPGWSECVDVRGLDRTATPLITFSDLGGRHALDQEQVPVIVADAGDGTAFRSLAPQIAPLLGPEQRLLHPAFLADYLEKDLSTNVVTHGFPGSGNVIFQTIMSRLLSRRRRGRFNLLESWAASGHILLCDFVRNAFAGIGASDVEIGYGQPGSLTMTACFSDNGNDRIFLPFVPSQVHLAEAVYGTHAAPCRNRIARLQALGGKVVLVARNPLDAIVAMAAKHPFEELLKMSEQNGEPLEVVRRKVVADTVDRNFHWMLAEQCAYLRGAEACAAAVKVFRYEDLLEDPTREIEHIAEYLDVDADARTIAELRALVGVAELGPRGHLNQPSVGKWKEALPPRHLAKARRVGLFQSAARFGYTAPAAIPTDEEPENGELNESSVSRLAQLYYLDDAAIRARAERHGIIERIGDLEVSSYSLEVRDRWRRKVDSDPTLRHVLRSMSFQQP